MAARVEDFAFHSNADYSMLTCKTGAISAWDSARGFFAVNAAQIIASYAVAVACAYGFYSRTFSHLNAQYGIATECTTAGYYSWEMANLYAYSATARQCTTGYYGYYRAYIYGLLTNANNNGNGADYNPAVSDAWGNSNASITWS